MELTVQNVYGLLLRSKLLSLDEAKGMYARWQEEARDTAQNVARFAAWMVQHRYLTDYQANLLARGHADGFFVNEYRILDRLGKGRMAGVYKAQHRLGQVVALKVLPPSKAADKNFLHRFQREAKLAMRLKHPNVVRAFQTGAAGGVHYLVMEYLEGETLEEVLARRGKLPPPEAVRLVYQALQGLQHIHAQGLVHRDLKPSNLMLTPAAPDNTLRSTVKILDIGLGRVLFEEGAPDITTDPGLTGEGVLLGTPDYMAPEQARDARSADIRADVYSLGCVLYHCLSGQPPFPDSNIISQMIRHATEPPRPLKELNAAVPDGLQQIVNWMLAKDPAARYPSPERAAQALQVFLAAGGADGPATPEADPKMRPFLTWLETEDKKPTPTVAANAAGGDAERTYAAARKKGKKRRQPPPSGPALPAAPAKSGPALPAAKSGAALPVAAVEAVHAVTASAADVELVTVAPPPAPAASGGLRLRDLLSFVLGALLGGAAVFAACLAFLKNRS